MRRNSIFFVVVLLFILSCTETPLLIDNHLNTRPALKEGLTMIEVSPQKGTLFGAYVQKGHTIYFQAIGKEIPLQEWLTVATHDPEAPLHDIDLRFFSANGDPFIVQAGGHTLKDPSWLSVVQQEEIDSVSRQKDLILARRAAYALENISLPEELEPERRSLIESALSATSPEQMFDCDNADPEYRESCLKERTAYVEEMQK